MADATSYSIPGRHELVVETVGLIADEQRRHPAAAYRQEPQSTLRSAAVYLHESPSWN